MRPSYTSSASSTWVCLLAIALAPAAMAAAKGPPSPKAVPLFNGKTLDGW